MSQSIELPEPVFEALQEAAAADGISPVAWIASRLPKAHKSDAKSLAELFEGRLGQIASGGGITWSEQTGQHFADYVEAKRTEGHL